MLDGAVPGAGSVTKNWTLQLKERMYLVKFLRKRFVEKKAIWPQQGELLPEYQNNTVDGHC